MKVIQLVPRLDLGGVERGTVDFAKYLVENNHEAIVVSAGGAYVDRLRKLGVKHYTLEIDRKSLWTILSSIKTLRKIILNEQADIVHARSRVPAIIGYVSSRKTQAQFITTCHGYYSQNFFGKVMGFSHQVICPSQVIARHMIDDFGIPARNIVLIPRGLNLEEFPFISPDKKDHSMLKICFLGRISPIKGIEYFIEAAQKYLAEHQNAEFYICGTAGAKHEGYEKFLKKMVVKAGLENKVIFKGKVNSALMLSECHVLVFPSVVHESFGRVLIEAQASGVVCIATALGAPAEIIDETTGILVTPKDSEAIKNALEKISFDDAFYKNLILSARKKVEEHYSLSTMGEKTLLTYRHALDQKHILIIKISSLGDIVLAAPSVSGLREKFPSAKIYFLCEHRFRAIAETIPGIDKIVVFHGSKNKFSELFRLSSFFRKCDIDIVIDLQNTWFSHFLAFLVFAKHTVGYNRNFGFLLDQKIPYAMAPGGPVESQKKILECVDAQPQMKTPWLQTEKSINDRCSNLLSLYGISPADRLVGINLRASTQWKTKGFSLSSILEITSYLLRRNQEKIIFIGEQNVRGFSEEIEKHLVSWRIINLCGKTDMAELVSLINRLTLLITPDSAPLHIAQAFGVKTIAFFGPTLAERHLVKTGDVEIITCSGLSCKGCYKKECSTYACFSEIKRIPEAIDRLLQ